MSYQQNETSNLNPETNTPTINNIIIKYTSKDKENIIDNYINEFKFIMFSCKIIKTYLNNEHIEKKKFVNLPPKWEQITESIINKGDNVFLIQTGLKSKLTILDFDNIESYNKLILKFPELKNRYTIRTKNGYHIYFKYYEKYKSRTDAFINYDKIDIINNGKFAAASPTSYILLNKKKIIYHLIDGLNIYDEIPDYLLDELILKKDIKDDTKEINNNEINIDDDKKEDIEINDKKEDIKINDDKKEDIKINDGKTKQEFIIKLLELLKLNNADEFTLWRNIGFICHYELNEDGFKVFDKFSKRSKKYNKKTVLEFWNSIQDDNIKNPLTIRTLFKYCKNDDAYEFNLLCNVYLWDSFNFYDMSTANIADHFKKLFGCKFIYQNEKVYNYNGVYWKCEEKIMPSLNNFISKEYYNYLFELFKKWENRQLINIKDDTEHQKKIEVFNKIRSSLTELKNYDKRQKYIKDIINKISDDEIKFDEEPYLFAFNNKIYDLKESKFIEPKPQHYISLTTGYNFIEQDETENIKELHILLNSIFPQEDLKKLYLTILSTGLDGVPLEKFVLANGSGGNGKGLLNEFYHYVLGNYAYVLPVNILQGPLKTGSNPEIANMNNKRVVTAREPDSRTPLYTSTIKEVTGGNELNARLNHSNKTLVKLCCLFLLECNSKPKLNEVNDALGRRILDIPFKNKFVDASTYEDLDDEEKKTTFLTNSFYKTQEFKEKFKFALFLILAEHHKEFYKNKRVLPITQEIKNRNKEYLASSDELLNWFDSKYEKTKNKKDIIKLKDIYEEYKSGDYFNNLNKLQKRTDNYKNFIEKIRTNMFLKKYITEIKETYIMTNYIKIPEEKVERDEDDDI